MGLFSKILGGKEGGLGVYAEIAEIASNGDLYVIELMDQCISDREGFLEQYAYRYDGWQTDIRALSHEMLCVIVLCEELCRSGSMCIVEANEMLPGFIDKVSQLKRYYEFGIDLNTADLRPTDDPADWSKKYDSLLDDDIIFSRCDTGSGNFDLLYLEKNDHERISRLLKDNTALRLYRC